MLTKAIDAGGLASTRVVAQGLQFLLFIVAARFLTTADFGIFSLAFAITLGLTVVAEAGWREYAVCSVDPEDTPRLNATAAAAGTVMATLLLMSSGAAWALGVDRQYAALGAILAIWVWLRPLATVQVGLLTRQNRLRELVALQLVSEAAGFVSGAVALWAGMGVLSLAIGKAALMVVEFGSAAWCIRSLKFHWPERRHFDEIVAFSRPILGARLLQFVQGNYSTLALGLLFSPAIVGIYRAAVRLVGTVQECVREPARYIGWSSLRAARDRREPSHDPFPGAAVGFFEAVCSVGIPALVLLALIAQPLVEVLLGSRWLDVAPLMSILAMAAAVRLLAVAVEPVLSLQGHPKLVQRNAMFVFAANLTCFAIAVPFGVHAIAWAELIAATITLPLTFRLMRRQGGIRTAPLVGALLPTVVGCAAGALGIWLLRHETSIAAWPAEIQIVVTGLFVVAMQLPVLLAFRAFRRRALPSREVPA